jgi:hypothetical protein
MNKKPYVKIDTEGFRASLQSKGSGASPVLNTSIPIPNTAVNPEEEPEVPQGIPFGAEYIMPRREVSNTELEQIMPIDNNIAPQMQYGGPVYKMANGGFVPENNPYDRFRNNTRDNSTYVNTNAQPKVLNTNEAKAQSEAFRLAEIQRQKDVKAKQDAEVKARMERMAKSEYAKTQPTTTENLAVIGDALGDKFRFSYEPNLFDDYLNPFVYLGDMAGALGNVPQNIKTGNYAGASSAIANPLLMGAMAGYSSKLAGTGFVNELFNPVVGMGYSKPSTLKNFKSEIDWAKWNKEIPENKALMQEYNAIEQQAKANNTWMKNSDGSPFQGTPEQFVQQNSENFKRAFPEYYGEKLNHNSPNKFNKISNKYFGTTTDRGWYGEGLYTHPEKEYTSIYGDNNYEFYVNSKNKGIINKENYNASKAYQRNYDLEFEKLNKEKQLQLQEIKNNPKEYTDFEFWNKIINNQYDRKLNNFLEEQQEGIKHNINQYTTLKNPQNGEVVIPFNNRIKSAVGNNGMFDMTNPNIFKAIAPIGLGAGLYSQQQTPEKFMYGGKVSKMMYGGTIKNKKY